MNKWLPVILITMIIDICIAPPQSAHAQYWGRRGRLPLPEREIFPSNCFTFCRVQYDSYQGRGRDWGGGWATDYDDSDLNFSQRLSELTSIQVNRDVQGNIKHAVVRLTDDALFHYPFIYMLEVGRLVFSAEEAERLRNYLERGGFLLVDDFWGSRAWENWVYEIAKVFPPEEFPMIDIPPEHEIFHIVFEIDEVPQIPGIGHWYQYGGSTSERFEDSEIPSCKGIFDKNGRLMVVVLHNTDLGDGWEEEAVNPVYFDQFSKRKAYPLGINIVVYAMTH
ncbi:MAG: DUF4159 domain-containing protein [Candidatus Omnitrophota bacterium]|jgi:hypothetical protein|nr:MAG: DUF4159 domain-containing protein [Candidatus Omnitrophota bacterium]